MSPLLEYQHHPLRSFLGLCVGPSDQLKEWKKPGHELQRGQLSVWMQVELVVV